MFDRETRREKVLEGLAKEARIKAASLSQNGMKSVVANVNLQSRLSQTGYEDIRRKAHGRSKKEELVEQLVAQADRSFYNSMKQVRDQRVRAGKPLQYSVSDHWEDHLGLDLISLNTIIWTIKYSQYIN